MNSTRLNKVSRLMQKELSIVLQKESKNMFSGVMLTVTVVRVAPDLSTARVYLSMFPSEKAKATLESIQKNAGKIKYELSQATNGQLRRLPDLSFYIDDSLDYIEKIEDLLKK